MLCLERKAIIFTLFALGILLCVSETEADNLDLGNIVKNLLSNMERSTVWDENMHFSLIFAEFIIKQKVRFYEPTRFENQLYEDILKRIATFRAKFIVKNGIGRLDNLLQKNVRLIKPAVIEDQINTELEYRTLKRSYEKLQNTGFPSSTLSDYCLLHISSLDKCDAIEKQCLQVISSNAPTFGYRRMHQILILYVLMHHTCAPQFGPQIVYEILSTQHCSEVYREHRLLAMSYSQARRDLYIEQSALCGLFGFKEFLNKAEVRKIASWDKFGICNCVGEITFFPASNENDICKCGDHSHSVALLFYVNAMLFLY
ncbi:uncharacterized protein LOC126754991 [Bactrocera neohumeralis]|uniref:uncharacterized protein LOC120771723 n=1 Tax=Bactrocera tryoni TaxID=59916 RepID=UPI001A9565F1|nr:uncharacterized protein LOC120771723 [Bactrocera tryoni]XP_050323188.1 uncharacterized protein LOC126754991 [Bactrocera neohumeralis]